MNKIIKMIKKIKEFYRLLPFALVVLLGCLGSSVTPTPRGCFLFLIVCLGLIGILYLLARDFYYIDRGAGNE